MITRTLNTERPGLALDFATAQLDPRIGLTRASSAATVVNSSGHVVTVGANLPRFQHNPVSLACEGLLIEEEGTNLFLYSEAIDTTLAWSVSNSSVEANTVVAPSNDLTACKLVEDTTVTEHAVTQTIAFSASDTVTLSLYAKRYGRDLRILMSDTATGVVYAFYNLTNGTYSGQVTSGSWSGIASSIEDVGGGWYRCTLTATKGAGANIAAVMTLYNGATTAYSGDGVSGAAIWGVQLETGAITTSYIPTTTAPATRNADVATISGTNFSDWFNPLCGTFFINTNARSGVALLTAGSYVLSADATGVKKYASIFTADPGATQLAIGSGTIREIAFYRQAFSPAGIQLLTSAAGNRSLIRPVLRQSIL